MAEAGASLAVLAAAVEADYARGAGVSSGQLRMVGTQTAGLEAVASGEVDAFALTSISLRSLLERARGQSDIESLPGVEPAPSAAEQVEVLEPFTPIIDGEPLLGCGGAAFRSNDADLRDAFNRELTVLREQGELLRILAPWGFTRAELPPADLTTEQLCRASGVGGTDYDPVPR
ncbi:MAG TPA: transporter substrate-binding domain-containing protein [Nocardioidaceae bacterium]|nr:transporter substrate-binding domain-containing protein [Nocardioidaceae bacterium]